MRWTFAKNWNIFFNRKFNIHRWAHVSIKYYYVLASRPTILQWKSSINIKWNTISRIRILTRISIFSQLNSPKYRITLSKTIVNIEWSWFYFISNTQIYIVNIRLYTTSIKKRSFSLFPASPCLSSLKFFF